MFLPDPSGHRDVALGLCRGGGRVLIVRNARSMRGRAEPCWDLPGGAARAGETLKEAVAREWEEEVGWRPEIGDLVLVVDGSKRAAPGATPLYTWRAYVFEVGPPPFGVMATPGAGIERVETVPTVEAVARLDAPYHAPLRACLRGDEARHATLVWIEDAPEAAPAPAAARLRRLLVLAAAAAVGDAPLVASEAAAALAEGLPREAVEEALLQVVPYAGFPRALAAFAAAREALGPAVPGPAEADGSMRSGAGEAAFAAVYADTAPRVRQGLASLHPLLPAWTLEFAYGRVLARPALPVLDRELLAVALLAALGRCDEALLGHARAALRLGATREDLDAAVAAAPSSAGDGKRAAARAVVARA